MYNQFLITQLEKFQQYCVEVSNRPMSGFMLNIEFYNCYVTGWKQLAEKAEQCKIQFEKDNNHETLLYTLRFPFGEWNGNFDEFLYDANKDIANVLGITDTCKVY